MSDAATGWSNRLIRAFASQPVNLKVKAADLASSDKAGIVQKRGVIRLFPGFPRLERLCRRRQMVPHVRRSLHGSR